MNRELELENCLREIAKDAEYGIMTNRECETLQGILSMAKRHTTGSHYKPSGGRDNG